MGSWPIWGEDRDYDGQPDDPTPVWLPWPPIPTGGGGGTTIPDSGSGAGGGNGSGISSSESTGRSIGIVQIAAPIANFSYLAYSGFKVKFANLSRNAVAYSWAFGDGTTSSEKDLVHQYPYAGVFKIVLVASNGRSTTTYSATIVVTAISASVDFTRIDCGLTLYFRDSSTILNTSWLWDFGDGGTSTLQNPSHAYAAAGNYTVTLTANNGVRTYSIAVSEFGLFTQEDYADQAGTVDGSSRKFPIAVDDDFVYFGENYTSGLCDIHILNKSDLSYDAAISPASAVGISGLAARDGKIFAGHAGGGNAIHIYDKTTRLEIGSFALTGGGNPRGIAVDETYIYVSRYLAGNDSIQRYNKTTYAYVDSFGPYGSGDGQFSDPGGIAVYAERVYCVNSDGGIDVKVQVFDKSSLAYLTKFLEHGTGNGKASAAYGVAINGNLCFAGCYGEVETFVNGSYSAYQPISVAETYNFSRLGVAIDTTHLFTVGATGSGNYRVRKFLVGNIAATPPTARFVVDYQAGLAPLAVAFTDQSAGAPTSWAWKFGDGSTSTSQNPTHTYAAAGIYEVELTATNASGSSVFTMRIVVEAITVELPAAPPRASFNMSAELGLAPVTINFTDTSAGSPASWFWTFGDGANSASQNPSHEYLAAGQYVVTLVATDARGWTSSASRTVIVTADLNPDMNPPTASVSVPASIIYRNVEVPFTAVVSTVCSYLWEFGDGQTSTQAAPKHLYAEPGTYTVRLTVANVYGQTTTTAEIIIIEITTRTMAQNRRYVVFRGLHVVRIYDEAGNFLNEFGGYGSTSGKFRYPNKAVAIRPSIT